MSGVSYGQEMILIRDTEGSLRKTPNSSAPKVILIKCLPHHTRTHHMQMDPRARRGVNWGEHLEKVAEGNKTQQIQEVSAGGPWGLLKWLSGPCESRQRNAEPSRACCGMSMNRLNIWSQSDMIQKPYILSKRVQMPVAVSLEQGPLLGSRIAGRFHVACEALYRKAKHRAQYT